MTRAVEVLERADVASALEAHPRLRLLPGVRPVTVAGKLDIHVQAPGYAAIADCFAVKMVLNGYPEVPPSVWSTDGRISTSFHSLSDGSFCLGSPLRLRLRLGRSYTLGEFIEWCVIPYLYGFAHQQAHGTLPFGELAHGQPGLVKDYERLFDVVGTPAVLIMITLLGMRRRDANKRPCPCGSGQRLGRCHNKLANRLRNKLGRRWCRSEAAGLYELNPQVCIADRKVRHALNALAPPRYPRMPESVGRYSPSPPSPPAARPALCAR